MTSGRLGEIPFRPVDDDVIAGLRDGFIAASFNPRCVCERIGYETMFEVRPLRENPVSRPDAGIDDALDVLIRLFVDGEAVERGRAERLLPADLRDAAHACGALRRAADGRYCPNVLLYPLGSLYIASDLGYDSEIGFDASSRPPDDVVYPALTLSTRDFLAMLPDAPAGRVLDLCAGTGVAGLFAASRADDVVAVDVTARSTAFAAFNARLNGIDNVSALCGDLYAPVAGEQFDRIVAHPPYLPSTTTRGEVYRDGGDDGEQITRRIFAGAWDHLAPGGRCCLNCATTDRRDAPIEYRIREMLGEHEADFDVVVIEAATFDPDDHFYRMAAAGKLSPDDAERCRRRLMQLGIQQLVYGSIVVRRRSTDRPTFTVRRKRGEAGRREIDWLLAWTEAAHIRDGTALILGSRPTVSPYARLRQLHRINAGHWIPEATSVTTDYPFESSARCSIEASEFLARCDGVMSVREHVQWMKHRGLLPAETEEAGFATLVRALIDGGFLEIDAFPFPRERPSAPA